MIKTFNNWPMLFLCYLGLFRTRLFGIGPYMVCTLRHSTKFKIRTGLPKMDDAGVITDIWTAKTRHEVSRIISDNGTIIDIGAHIGAFTLMAATRGKNIKVYACEPDPENFNLLQDNIRLNNLEGRVTPLNLALVGVKGVGTRKLNITSSPETSSFYFSEGDKGIEVRCTTLESIIEENRIECCDFLKVDCEGAEYEILLNASQECLNKMRKIHVEFHEFPGLNYNRHDLIQKLTSAGFEVTEKSWHPNFGYIYAERLAPENANSRVSVSP